MLAGDGHPLKAGFGLFHGQQFLPVGADKIPGAALIVAGPGGKGTAPSFLYGLILGVLGDHRDALGSRCVGGRSRRGAYGSRCYRRCSGRTGRSARYFRSHGCGRPFRQHCHGQRSRQQQSCQRNGDLFHLIYTSVLLFLPIWYQILQIFAPLFLQHKCQIFKNVPLESYSTRALTSALRIFGPRKAAAAILQASPKRKGTTPLSRAAPKERCANRASHNVPTL